MSKKKDKDKDIEKNNRNNDTKKVFKNITVDDTRRTVNRRWATDSETRAQALEEKYETGFGDPTNPSQYDTPIPVNFNYLHGLDTYAISHILQYGTPKWAFYQSYS